LSALLSGEEGSGTPEQRKGLAEETLQRIRDYASDETGLQPGSNVWIWSGSDAAKLDHTVGEPGSFQELITGKSPKPGQRLVYVDGGFDLFSSGHIEFLRRVLAMEYEEGHKRGWYLPEQKDMRIRQYGEDYGPAYVIAGVHDDHVINHWKGLNYPIMNIFERGLCVLQCRVSSRYHHIYLSSHSDR
jgi:ethanolamine-phosphate cytidylyltransferase